jgi:hypothetical protein
MRLNSITHVTHCASLNLNNKPQAYRKTRGCVGRTLRSLLMTKKVQFVIIFSIIQKYSLIFPFSKARMSLVE